MLRVSDEILPKRVMNTEADPLQTEQELISRILAGDAELFRELVDQNKDRVFSMIVRQVGDASLAEELAQETFIKAYKGLKGFGGKSKFSTWITRIAINTSHSYFSSKRHKQSLQNIPFELSKHEQAGDMVSAHEQEQRHAKFRQCLSKLGEKFRAVIVLNTLENKSYEEVADVVSIPVGTVRSRLHKARILLRDCMLADAEKGEAHE